MKFIIYFLTLLLIVGCHNSSHDPLFIQTLKAEKTFWTWKREGKELQVHYIETGSGENHLLLLHGFGANTYTWRHQIDALAEEGYHVWAFDFIGFGLSDKPLDLKYGQDLFLAQSLAFMKEKGINQAHLIGNSMGGAIALSVAAAAPDLISSLILIDPLAYPIDLPLAYSLAKKFGRFSLPFFTRGRVEKTLQQVYFDPKKISKEQIEAYWIPYQTEGGKEAALSTLSAFDPQEIKALIPSYPTIQASVLLIWGENDSWIPVSHLSRLAQVLPHSEQALISSCGHAPQEEQPEKTTPLILEFLSKN